MTQRTFGFLSALVLAAPLAVSQTPGPAPAPGAPGMMAQKGAGGDHGMRKTMDHRGPMMHEGMGHEGMGGLSGLRVPPGTWWRSADVVSRVGLSADQVKKIDGIFLEARVQLIHMHATLEEEQVRLEPLLAANPMNEQAAMGQIAKIADTRADLEKADAKMLLGIRGVLTGDQWTKLQQRPMGRGPGGMGRPMGDGGGVPAPGE